MATDLFGKNPCMTPIVTTHIQDLTFGGQKPPITLLQDAFPIELERTNLSLFKEDDDVER